ncbi:MAG: WYL domain-containing protein [Clostridiaceae bacterium]|nr:WYL domain-containing protein [Clostridiaceae bacterium]
MIDSENVSTHRKIIETYYLIKRKEATNRKELADILDTSEKTIGNYIKKLKEDWEVDIKFDYTLNQYHVEDEGLFYQLRGTKLLQEEDIHMILSALNKIQDFTPEKINYIRGRLLSLFPGKEMDVLRKSFYRELGSIKPNNTIESNIQVINSAIIEKKKIEFLYLKASTEKLPYEKRVVSPYYLAEDFGKYYVISKKDNDHEFRNYRIDRMSQVKKLEENAVLDQDFNAEKYLKQTWYMNSGKKTKVKVKFNIDAYQVVTERHMQVGKVIEKDEDSFIYEFIANGTKGIMIWILGFGNKAEVLEPWELREEIKNIAEKMLGVYK